MDITTVPTGDPTLHMMSATIAAVALHGMDGTCPAQHVNPRTKLAPWHHAWCLHSGDLPDVRTLPVHVLNAEVHWGSKANCMIVSRPREVSLTSSALTGVAVAASTSSAGWTWRPSGALGLLAPLQAGADVAGR